MISSGQRKCSLVLRNWLKSHSHQTVDSDTKKSGHLGRILLRLKWPLVDAIIASGGVKSMNRKQINGFRYEQISGKKKKHKSKALRFLAIIGGIVVLLGIAYAVYRFFAPDYLEDFEDDFEEDFEEYFDDGPEEARTAQESDTEDPETSTDTTSQTD